MKKFKTPHETTTVVLSTQMLQGIDDLRTRQGTSKAAVIRQLIAVGLPILKQQMQYSVADESREGAQG